MGAEETKPLKKEFRCQLQQKETPKHRWHVEITPDPVVTIKGKDAYPAKIEYKLWRNSATKFPKKGAVTLADGETFPFCHAVTDGGKLLTITVKEDDPTGDFSYIVYVKGAQGNLRGEDPEIHNDGP